MDGDCSAGCRPPRPSHTHSPRQPQPADPGPTPWSDSQSPRGFSLPHCSGSSWTVKAGAERGGWGAGWPQGCVLCPTRSLPGAAPRGRTCGRASLSPSHVEWRLTPPEKLICLPGQSWRRCPPCTLSPGAGRTDGSGVTSQSAAADPSWVFLCPLVNLPPHSLPSSSGAQPLCVTQG